MSPYRVRVGTAATKEIKKLDRSAQGKLIMALELLATDPRPKGVEKLSHDPRFWRIRNGHYRAIYFVDDDAQTIYVLVVRHRKDAYRNLGMLDRRLVAATLAPLLPG
jgi:mRNA interferase RelE/StbE